MDIDALIENHFKEKNRNFFGFDAIAELIEEVMDSMEAPGAQLLEQIDTSPQRATFEWSMIPDIPISEIGWSDVSTVEVGGKQEQILGPQRALLQQYLDNIGSSDGTFASQIASLEEFYTNGPQRIVAGAKNNAEVISKLISYLVFYKTLTKVVTNFNAASAGFNFESFLATLLHGTQIKANTGTIADFLTGDNIPISLKLYAEKTLHVGGSFTDLVNDLTEPQFSHPAGNGMRYVVCTKNIDGEGLEQKGTITFYQFDFTLQNVLSIIATSMEKSQKNARLPRQLIQNGVDVAGDLPAADKLPSPEELEKEFTEALETMVKSADFRNEMPEIISKIDPEFPSDADIEKILQGLEYSRDRRQFFNDNWKGLGKTYMKESAVRELLVQYFISKNSDNLPIGPAGRVTKGAMKVIQTKLGHLGKVIKKANDAIVDRLSASEVNRVRDELIGQIEFEEDLNVILEYYNNPQLTDEQRKIALKNSYGYLNTRQFELNRAQATNEAAPINTQNLGVITIGGSAVEKMLQQVSAILNEEIFAVFTSLKTLSDSLNGFFAGGLSDDSKAKTAIDSAQDIEKKTSELKSEK